MTNREKLSKMSNEELARFICNLIETEFVEAADKLDLDFCDLCPFQKGCRKGHSGVLTYLESEEEK